ncbi:DNA-3-methyladenine glycosylase I [Kushneria pakistanensis]|uniref:DNA-3-methyladenine glycosylase I n=1 Tax=Kushneria pakistanensis TaxID=1508770 RepID=A0ABQ3FBE5_9GAMM|nr:DNA-3-methyladenine glycosylase I [Kushneria pakistanensis]GHC16544.1 DNA-3-methyladenine glycosylase I [Kushneria pakistanensis]
MMDMAAPIRCQWAQGHPLLAHYHDDEWGVPESDSRALWEKLILDGFQAGLSWLTVLKKRDAFRDAFEGFDPERVARFNAHDVERLLNNTAIIRSRAKIEATIGNARAFLRMQEQGEAFATFCWSMVDDRPLQNLPPVPAHTPLSVSFSKALKARGFKFVGPTIVYAWMQATGMVNDHAPDCHRRQVVAAMGKGAMTHRS